MSPRCKHAHFAHPERFLSLAAVVLTSGFVSHVSHEQEASELSYRALRFASTVSIVVIPHAGIEEGARKVLSGVTDLALVPVELASHEEGRSSWKRMAPFGAACLIGVLLAWYALRHNAW